MAAKSLESIIQGYFFQFQDSNAKECKFKSIAKNGAIEPEFELDLELKDTSLTKDQIQMDVEFISDCKGRISHPKKISKVTFDLKYETTFIKANKPKFEKLQ